MRLTITISSAALLCAAFFATQAQEIGIHHSPTVGPLAVVSGLSPYPRGCQGQQAGIDYVEAAVEPSVAVDPGNPLHLIGVWQQGRWSNGGADGLLTAVSMDSGVSWKNTSAPFSTCTGGTSARASDPWVTISPNGVAFQISLIVDNTATSLGVMVSRSTDGGFTWSTPAVIDQSNLFDDKETITADPTNSNYVYAVWDRTAIPGSQPALISRTTDGGVTWEPAQTLYAPGANTYIGSNQILALPDGTLVHEFILATGSNSYVATRISKDRGNTWSGPYAVASDNAISVVDPNTQTPIRTGNGIPSSAVDPNSGVIYITWEDARFSNNQREGVALSKSLDGGHTWSFPQQVNQIPAVQAFNPTVAVNAAGAVAITYYDFRQATGNTSQLLTSYWQVVSNDGGSTWTETPVAGPFDIQLAAQSGTRGYFLGDYQALAASGNSFVPFFVATNPAKSLILSSVFALPQPRTGSTAWNGHTEVNHRPHPWQPKALPKRR